MQTATPPSLKFLKGCRRGAAGVQGDDCHPLLLEVPEVVLHECFRGVAGVLGDDTPVP